MLARLALCSGAGLAKGPADADDRLDRNHGRAENRGGLEDRAYSLVLTPRRRRAQSRRNDDAFGRHPA